MRNGIDGFIVPTRDSEVIASKLKLIYKNSLARAANESNIYYRQQINTDAQNKLKDCLLAI